jgi:hypothetical protein
MSFTTSATVDPEADIIGADYVIFATATTAAAAGRVIVKDPSDGFSLEPLIPMVEFDGSIVP